MSDQDVGVDQFDSGWSFQFEGNDLVHLWDPDEDGFAMLTVFASTDPDAPILFQTRVDVFAHRKEGE